MKKVLSVLLAAATAVSVCGGLAACGEDDKTLTVWAPSAAVPAYKEYVKGFKTAYPEYKDYTVKFAAQEEDVVQDKLGSGAQIGSRAHVFFFPSDHLTALKNKGALQALTSNYVTTVNDRDEEKVVEDAMRDEKLYAFPATYDNGYMLYYDKTFYTNENDVKSLDTLQAKARAAKKTILFNYGSGYYASSMFWAAGVEFGYEDEDKLEGYYANKLTDKEGVAIAEACYKYFNPGVNANGDGTEATVIIDGDVNTGIGEGFANGTMVAGIGGSWAWANIKKQMGANDRDAETEIGVTTLPTFTYQITGEANPTVKHMYSFIGYKYCGVNAKKPTEEIRASLALAEYLTREEGQLVRYESTNSGPSNKNLLENNDDIKNDPILAAFHAQEEYGVPQRSHPSAFWSPSFISNIANGSTKLGKVVEELNKWNTALIEG